MFNFHYQLLYDIVDKSSGPFYDFIPELHDLYIWRFLIRKIRLNYFNPFGMCHCCWTLCPTCCHVILLSTVDILYCGRFRPIRIFEQQNQTSSFVSYEINKLIDSIHYKERTFLTLILSKLCYDVINIMTFCNYNDIITRLICMFITRVLYDMYCMALLHGQWPMLYNKQRIQQECSCFIEFI